MANAKQIKNEENLLSDWIAFPRKISSMYKNGEINRPEYLVCLHLRLQANPYGISSTCLEAIRNDVFGKSTGHKGVTLNYVNKILLSLKRKRMLYYQDRAGRSGSFEIRFADFIDPNKNITDIKHLFESDYSKRSSTPLRVSVSEVTAELKEENQRFENPINEGVKTNEDVGAKGIITGYNNDTDIQNKIENTDISVSYKKGDGEKPLPEYVCRNPTDSFAPNGYEENTAKEIAGGIGEKCMDRYLALIRKGQFGVLEKAFGEFKEDLENGKNPSDKPAYLNSIITRMLKEKIGK